MDIQLGSVRVRLNTPDQYIDQGWQSLFAGWRVGQSAVPAITLNLDVVTTIPPPPPVPLVFQHPLTKLAVYQPGDEWQLHFPGRAVVQFPAGQMNSPVQITGQATAEAAGVAILEDITFTALAPWLRRLGWYLVHAFAVVRERHSFLLVGPSYSGKTTTGLRLVLAGWQLLGNDLVLLQYRPEGVFALSTPGQIRIRPGTLSLLPQLQPTIEHLLPDGSAILNRASFALPSRFRPVRVTHAFFPQVRPEVQSKITPLSQGVTLARMAEESLDRWDSATLHDHLDCLQYLSAQVEGFSLTLGGDAETLIDQLKID